MIANAAIVTDVSQTNIRPKCPKEEVRVNLRQNSAKKGDRIMNNSRSESYKAAGVDITAGYKAVELMKKHIARTITRGAASDIGGFGGIFELDLTGIKKSSSSRPISSRSTKTLR